MRKPTKLQYYRKYINGMTLKELSEKAGVNINTLITYDNGRKDLNNASVIFVKKLARALNCTIDDLTDSLEEIAMKE